MYISQDLVLGSPILSCNGLHCIQHRLRAGWRTTWGKGMLSPLSHIYSQPPLLGYLYLHQWNHRSGANMSGYLGQGQGLRCSLWLISHTHPSWAWSTSQSTLPCPNTCPSIGFSYLLSSLPQPVQMYHIRAAWQLELAFGSRQGPFQWPSQFPSQCKCALWSAQLVLWIGSWICHWAVNGLLETLTKVHFLMVQGSLVVASRPYLVC